MTACFWAAMPCCIFVALAFLWVNGQCDALGGRIQDLEKELKEARQESLDERLKWSQMTSLKSIHQALTRHGIEMSWPSEDRIVRVGPDARPMLQEVEEAPAAEARYARLDRVRYP